jgi:SEFIR domain
MTEQDISTKPPATICRVFISYSHDSPEHRQRVLALANQLRKDGVEAWIDQYIQDPDEGWIRWMRSQIRQASRVLLVFTELYQRRFDGAEEEGKGLGATFEGSIVTQALYESGGRNAKFRPVVFREEDEGFIPSELRQFNRYRIDTPEDYEALLRWLHEAPKTVVPNVGQKPFLPSKPASDLFSTKQDKPHTSGRDATAKNIYNSPNTGSSLPAPSNVHQKDHPMPCEASPPNLRTICVRHCSSHTAEQGSVFRCEGRPSLRFVALDVCGDIPRVFGFVLP